MAAAFRECVRVFDGSELGGQQLPLSDEPACVIGPRKFPVAKTWFGPRNLNALTSGNLNFQLRSAWMWLSRERTLTRHRCTVRCVIKQRIGGGGGGRGEGREGGGRNGDDL